MKIFGLYQMPLLGRKCLICSCDLSCQAMLG